MPRQNRRNQNLMLIAHLRANKPYFFWFSEIFRYKKLIFRRWVQIFLKFKIIKKNNNLLQDTHVIPPWTHASFMVAYQIPKSRAEAKTKCCGDSGGNRERGHTTKDLVRGGSALEFGSFSQENQKLSSFYMQPRLDPQKKGKNMKTILLLKFRPNFSHFSYFYL